MPMEQIIFQAPAEFKELLAEYAQQNNLPMGEVIRQAVAPIIGYDVSQLPKRYTSAEERYEAKKSRQATRRELQKRILDALQSGNTKEARRLAKELNNK